MKKRTKLLSLGIIAAAVLIAGFSSCDAFLPKGTVSGTVLSYTTDEGISGVSVTVAGHTGFTTTTNSSGSFSFEVPSGTQTLSFSKTGFVFSDVQVAVSVGETTAVSSNSIYGQPVLSSNQYRIVLTWGETPADLDSHLITPSGEEIYYHNKETTAGDANLDVDNTTSYGPETVTITAPQSGTYRYYVFNYSEKDNGTDTSLTTSHAVVRVYNSSGLLKTYTVPATGAGLYWNVFTLNGSTITDVNAIGTVPPSGSTYSANRASRK